MEKPPILIRDLELVFTPLRRAQPLAALHPIVRTIRTDCAGPEVWSKQGWGSEPQEVVMIVAEGGGDNTDPAPTLRKGWGPVILWAIPGVPGKQSKIYSHSQPPRPLRPHAPPLFRFPPTVLPTPWDVAVILNPHYLIKQTHL